MTDDETRRDEIFSEWIKLTNRYEAAEKAGDEAEAARLLCKIERLEEEADALEEA